MRKRNKYGARKYYSSLLKRTFHSISEGHYGEHLYARQENGEISDLQFQVRVKLCSYITMIVDFRYFDNRLGEEVWCEFKGMETGRWKLQRSAWAAGLGPGLYLVVKKNRSKAVPYSETLIRPIEQKGTNND